MRSAKLALLTVALTAAASAWPSAQAQKIWTVDDLFRRNIGTREDQDTPFTPHKILGNLYYVGTRTLGSFLITTPQGHILINSDYERNVPAVRQSIEALGFKYTDIRILLGSHAHADHMEGDALVKELTGATVMAMAEDVPALQVMLGPNKRPHPIDKILHDGDKVELGGMTLVAHLTPGHTRGCTTWTFNITEGGKTFSVLVIGSVGVNPGMKLVGNTDAPQIAQEFQRSFAFLRSQHPDIPLGSHPGMYNMNEKFAKLGRGGASPYVDPAGYVAELDIVEGVFKSVLAQQQGTAANVASGFSRTEATAGDIDGGKQLFNGMCVECHGAGGAGGDAPSLNRARLMHAPTDAALMAILTNGIPNTNMPRIRRFTDTEMRQLVAYVRSLGRVAEVKLPGDSKKGADVYKGLGCAGCHIITGQGGNLGPDLSDIGFLRGAAYLKESVLDPSAALPKGVMQIPSRGYAEYLPLRVVTKQGAEVRGIRVNEDAFTVQLRDQAGKFYSLRKADIELLDKQMGKSLMPSFANRFKGTELDDLVAYLASLRSEL
jgi:metallo-beta-lactamase class B